MPTRTLNTINLDDLEKFAKLLHDIEPLVDKLLAAAAVLPQIQEIADKGVNVLSIDDRFMRRAEAAKCLCMSQNEITKLVKAGKLTPYYTPNSSVRKFNFKEVKALAKTEPWEVKVRDD